MQIKCLCELNWRHGLSALGSKSVYLKDFNQNTQRRRRVDKHPCLSSMRKEAGYLRSIRSARARIKEVIEGPDTVIDRIVRSIRDNHGEISNKLRKSFPLLEEDDIGVSVLRIVQEEFGMPETTPDQDEGSGIRLS
ncbi:hypothetical protein Q9L42_021115 (plasmid) [Methylomarinum sp. Ch1-1]|uniref:Uncharacterized protein n=1 Tax=Methylomarinum roseum TaxID=3067653 RepID=A0AAU7P0D8_9GAMM